MQHVKHASAAFCAHAASVPPAAGGVSDVLAGGVDVLDDGGVGSFAFLSVPVVFEDFDDDEGVESGAAPLHATRSPKRTALMQPTELAAFMVGDRSNT